MKKVVRAPSVAWINSDVPMGSSVLTIFENAITKTIVKTVLMNRVAVSS